MVHKGRGYSQGSVSSGAAGPLALEAPPSICLSHAKPTGPATKAGDAHRPAPHIKKPCLGRDMGRSRSRLKRPEGRSGSPGAQQRRGPRGLHQQSGQGRKPTESAKGTSCLVKRLSRPVISIPGLRTFFENRWRCNGRPRRCRGDQGRNRRERPLDDRRQFRRSSLKSSSPLQSRKPARGLR